MSYYIKNGDRYVTKTEITKNGILVYYLSKKVSKAQLFTRLEADMFLAMIRRSTLLSNKEKKGYRAITGDQLLEETFGMSWEEALKGKRKIQHNARHAENND